ncbi:MAG: Crp/Fnr family transcriptional regulator [Candidatus Saccharimonadales bacterium]
MNSDTSTISQLQEFLAGYATKTFTKGEIIIFQGEAPRSAYVVRTGTVKAYNLSVNGDEKPVSFHSEGSIFPAAWVYGKVASAIYYYEAFTPEVTLYVVDRSDYVAFIREQPDIMFAQLEGYLMDQLGKSMRLNALQHSRATDKLLYTLHYLALSHGKSIGAQRIQITLDLTHQDFANLTGLTRETAATELNKLKHRGVISYGKGEPYVLDLAKLMSLLNDQYIADMQIKL